MRSVPPTDRINRSHQLLSVLWRRKLVFGFFYLVLVWAIIVAMMLSSPTYEVSAMIAVQPGLYGRDAGKVVAATRPEQIARTQIALLESEDVIRRAIDVVGVDNILSSGGKGLGYSLFAHAIHSLKLAVNIKRLQYAGASSPAGQLSLSDSAYITVRRALKISPEQFTDIIRVTFRHANPRIAVTFTNALVQAYTDKYFDVYSNAKAVTFFWDQQKRSQEAFARASSALTEFSSSNQIFRIEEQRRLLLEQRGRLSYALISTKGSLAEKESQAKTIPVQLEQMKPINRLPQITALTQLLAEPGDTGGQARIDKRKKDLDPGRTMQGEPPLLLVRVYQETVATLVRLNTELAGLRALETVQQQSLRKTEEELGLLSMKEVEFERLQVEATQAKQNAELYRKKALEEQLAQDLNAKRLSSVQVVQQATMPVEPISPKPFLLGAIGMMLSLAPFLGLIAVYQAISAKASLHAEASKPRPAVPTTSLKTARTDRGSVPPDNPIAQSPAPAGFIPGHVVERSRSV